MSRRLDPKERKQQLMDVAMELAREHGYDRVKRSDVARRANVTDSTISRYFNTMSQLHRDIMRQAIKRGDTIIVGQGLARKDKRALSAPKELRERAAASLI